MKDFDELRSDDLSFKIGGEPFVMQYVPPEVLSEYEDSLHAEARAAEAEEKAAEEGAEPTANGDVNSAAKTIERMDRRIKSFLDPKDHDRYTEMRGRTGADAVPYWQLKELERWMVETQSSRPTDPPSPSASGPGRKPGRSSTAKPSSAEATPVA